MKLVAVNPIILSWARTTAGLSLEDAARRLQVAEAKGQAPRERLAALEAGTTQPTRALLLRMARVYRRPLILFYLDAPPPRSKRVEDFRRADVTRDNLEEALLDALVRDVRARQDLVRAVLEEEDEARPLKFVASVSQSDGLIAVRQRITADIGFDLQAFRRSRTFEEAFTYLRTRLESAGLFVLLVGDLGSHHTALPTDAFRGFALADAIAPFIVANDHDSKAAWSFTLLHEAAHIWLGKTGISDPFAETTLERFCNDIASGILLAPQELQALDVSNSTPTADAIQRINAFGRARKISSTMVAYRLYRSDRISFEKWTLLRAEFHRLWIAQKDRQRELAKQNKDGGPDYYIVRRHRVGPALLDLMARMTSSGSITSTKAGKVLGVRTHNVYSLLHPAA